MWCHMLYVGVATPLKVTPKKLSDGSDIPLDPFGAHEVKGFQP